MWTFSLLLFWGSVGWGWEIWNSTFRWQDSRGPDVNECENTSVCPPFSTCTNTLESYYCTCKLGFLTSNGQMKFKGTEAECKDVDECSATPSLCGPASLCKNLPGVYKCSCFPGFSAAHRTTWVPRKTGRLTCSDVDECLNSSICPENSDCVNSVGSYSCSCQAGFVSRNSTCEDIDECFQDQLLCGLNSVCTNVLGSYNCRCMVGFRPDPESSWKDRNFNCKRVTLKCKEDVIPDNEQVQKCQGRAAMGPGNVPFCAIMNATFSVLDGACENKTTAVSLEGAVESFASVLEETDTWSNFTKEETSTLATIVLESVENTVLAAFLKPSENDSQTIQTESVDVDSKVIKEECNEEEAFLNLKAKGDGMKIRCSTIEESESAGTTGVALVSFSGMESILDERYFQDPQDYLTNSKKFRMNSRIIMGVMTGEKKDGFSETIIYSLENTQPKQALEKPMCVSWSTDIEGGRWTPSGCLVLNASEMHTTCSCNRMGNLAIIMASSEPTMEFSLYVISHVGMIISLVCLALAIATFLLCRAIRSHNTHLHLHLCVCLFLAKSLFLVGIDKTDNKIGCAIIAGFLHYFFLACFFWMLVEAIMLFLMVRNLKVVNYFSSHNIKMLHLCAFGYGLPGVVVVISASAQPRGYGMHNRCWLNTETGFIWSFLGPVCTIIMVNTILLTWTLWNLRKKLSCVNTDISTLKDSRLLTFKAFAQLFILGCSWVLGIFQIGPIASLMAYLFTIINSLQGALIFLIHCLLNHQVREEYKRWITRKTKSSSQSQTSGILLSSVSSTSKMG
ncbi:adhesion G protein-coupled receptor E1 [Echinops telfairi]|uniref:Adhesion G protein-coupled receptor E1 n=1 Tax=Echinops telfairi TaxID=9371 RepID=A0AC59C743_ECHTE|nr:adhesion G protein-coupled receptor E1 [Echinops telfairi]